MTNSVDLATTAESADADSVLSESVILTRGTNDTDTGFETAVLTFPSDSSIARVGRIGHQSKIPPLISGIVQTCREPISTALGTAKRKISRPIAEPFAIETSQSREVRLGKLEAGVLSLWQQSFRGIPGWLTSLIFHLTVIMILALVSVSDGGRKVIALLAVANESVEIEPFASFDLAPEPEEIETLAEEIELSTSKLMQTSDLSPLLDEALLNASLENESTNDLFESISTAGISESDLPRRIEGEGTQFYGVEGKGSNFVFVVDCSGSMANYGRWNQAVRELKKSVSRLKIDQKFLVLLYNDGFIAMNDEAELVASTPIQQKRAFKWLANSSPGNWTFCAAALEKALSLKPDAVFLLSDGEFNDRQDVFLVLESMNGIQNLGRYQQQQIPIHTIALGSHQGSWTMKRIADENNGDFQLIE